MLKSVFRILLNKARGILFHRFKVDPVTFVRFGDDASLCLEKLGSDYGGWIIPTSLVNQDSVCYCVGVGEDITFDQELIKRFSCKVYAFDPTPRAKIFVEKTAKDLELFCFRDYGIYDENSAQRFYAPKNPLHVSHSIENLQSTEDYFEATCKKISTAMKEEGHDHIDLLKLDIEGAEYKVIDSLIKEKIKTGILCVEFDEAYNPLDEAYASRIRASVRKLLANGYKMVAAEPNCNYTFVRPIHFACQGK